MSVSKERITKETKIAITLKRGLEPSVINTIVGFLNHMLDLFAFHGHFVLDVQVDGDTDVDDHHTTEDVGIVLGSWLNWAGQRRHQSLRECLCADG